MDRRLDATTAGPDADADAPPPAAAASALADDVPANPRKRKKSSRACDFCHTNHQPCDNSQPRCSYCQKHDKQCLYLRPQKKRGPAQGYRTALHTMRESAAAWGAALNLIPSLGPVIEGYVKGSDEGKRLVRAIKDPQQQEFFIQAWQQSTVFKAFFDDDGSPEPTTEGGEPPAAHLPAPPSVASLESPAAKAEPALKHHVPTPSPSHDGGGKTAYKTNHHSSASEPAGLPPLSLSDIVAKDAVRSSQSFSQTLGSLGFAPDETLDDFLAMSFNPDPMEHAADVDPSLGTEMDQKAYYELLMGKRFG